MKYLIFEQEWQGHRLEYIHHQYMYAGENLQYDNIIIAITSKLKDRIRLLDWPIFNNVEIVYLSDEEIDYISSSKLKFTRSWRLSRILYQYYKIYKPDKIIINELISFLPVLPIFLRRHNLVRGIIYRIPRYRVNPKFYKIIIDNFVFWLMAKCHSIDRVWLLNDASSTEVYNDKYGVKKFTYLPDPINIKGPLNIEYPNITEHLIGKTVFLHAGGLGLRKGTNMIIDAIKLLPEDELQNKAFIFAGSYADMSQREKMIRFIEEYRDKVQLCFLDSFIPFESLAGYFTIADFLLLPYTSVAHSSGILGYSAYFHKPVIGPKEGLLGELIDKYRLGITINDLSPDKLKNQIIRLSRVNDSETECYGFDNYVAICTIDKFAEAIFHN